MFTWISRRQDKIRKCTRYGMSLIRPLTAENGVLLPDVSVDGGKFVWSSSSSRHVEGKQERLRSGIRPCGWQYETLARWQLQPYQIFSRREFEGLSPIN